MKSVIDGYRKQALDKIQDEISLKILNTKHYQKVARAGMIEPTPENISLINYAQSGNTVIANYSDTFRALLLSYLKTEQESERIYESMWRSVGDIGIHDFVDFFDVTYQPKLNMLRGQKKNYANFENLLKSWILQSLTSKGLNPSMKVNATVTNPVDVNVMNPSLNVVLPNAPSQNAPSQNVPAPVPNLTFTKPKTIQIDNSIDFDNTPIKASKPLNDSLLISPIPNSNSLMNSPEVQNVGDLGDKAEEVVPLDNSNVQNVNNDSSVDANQSNVSVNRRVNIIEMVKEMSMMLGTKKVDVENNFDSYKSTTELLNKYNINVTRISTVSKFLTDLANEDYDSFKKLYDTMISIFNGSMYSNETGFNYITPIPGKSFRSGLISTINEKYKAANDEYNIMKKDNPGLERLKSVLNQVNVYLGADAKKSVRSNTNFSLILLNANNTLLIRIFNTLNGVVQSDIQMEDSNIRAEMNNAIGDAKVNEIEKAVGSNDSGLESGTTDYAGILNTSKKLSSLEIKDIARTYFNSLLMHLLSSGFSDKNKTVSRLVVAIREYNKTYEFKDAILANYKSFLVPFKNIYQAGIKSNSEIERVMSIILWFLFFSGKFEKSSMSSYKKTFDDVNNYKVENGITGYKFGDGLKRGDVSFRGGQYEDRVMVTKRLYIDRNVLNKNIFEMRYVSNKHLTNLKPVSIDDNTKRLLLGIIDKNEFNKTLYSKIPEPMQYVINKILIKLGKESFISEFNNSFEERFKILKAEYEAGNDSEALRKELRMYIKKAMVIGLIKKADAYDMLCELSM